MQVGLEPQGGAHTRMARQYPPCVFLALDLPTVLEFVEFRCKELPAVIRQFQDIPPPRERHQLKVWRVRPTHGMRLYRDILFTKRAGWVDVVITPKNVSLVRYWRQPGRTGGDHSRHGG
jgi:hypothetical protein